MRVPLPAARTTIWTSVMTSLIIALIWAYVTPAVGGAGGGGFQSGAERLVVSKHFQIGIAPRQRPVLGVQCDGALEMGERLGVLTALRVGNGEHIQGVIVVRIFVTDEAQVGNRFVVAAAVDRQRRRVQPFIDAGGRRLARCRLPVADVHVETHPLMQLFLFRVAHEHRFEQLFRLAIVMPLQCFEALFVKGDGFDVGGPVRLFARFLRRSGDA